MHINKVKASSMSPQLGAILTENQGDESHLGQEDAMGRSPVRTQFIVGNEGVQLASGRNGLHPGSRNH